MLAPGMIALPWRSRAHRGSVGFPRRCAALSTRVRPLRHACRSLSDGGEPAASVQGSPRLQTQLGVSLITLRQSATLGQDAWVGTVGQPKPDVVMAQDQIAPLVATCDFSSQAQSSPTRLQPG